MRRAGLFGCSLCKVSGWGYSAKGSVWSVMVVEVLEPVEDWIERLDGSGQVVDGVEFVSPGAIASVDRAVHLRRLGRKDEEPQALFLAGDLELGHELGTTVDLDGLHREGHLGDQLVEEDRGRGGGCPIEGLGDGPFRDGVVGGEVFDGFVGRDIDVDGVELDEAAGLVDRQVARQALGEAAFGGPAAGVRTSSKRGDGLNRAAPDELGR